MSNSDIHDQRIAKMTFSSVYPLYLAKVEKKGRTKDELHKVIRWLTGYSEVKSAGADLQSVPGLHLD